jgi:hypothetical protein
LLTCCGKRTTERATSIPANITLSLNAALGSRLDVRIA